MTHLSEEAVEWLARHGARPERQHAAAKLGWSRHVDDCAECREMVEEKRGNNEFLNSVKKLWIKLIQKTQKLGPIKIILLSTLFILLASGCENKPSKGTQWEGWKTDK